MAGFIYIMSNPAFPTLLKIGKSKKNPTTDRVNELNQTGVPEPFKVEYYAFVEDEEYLERVVHKRFASQRPNKNREFFSVETHEVINVIRLLASQSSALKYEQVSVEDASTKMLKHTRLGLILDSYLQQFKAGFLNREERFQNTALKILIPTLLLIILLGSMAFLTNLIRLASSIKPISHTEECTFELPKNITLCLVASNIFIN